MEEISLEIEGQHYLGQREATCEGPRYSFDRGVTWYRTKLDAFLAAQREGKLTVVGGDTGEAGEFEAFFLALLKQVQELEPGESIRVLRDATTFMILKEQMITAVRASAARDVELSMGEDTHNG